MNSLLYSSIGGFVVLFFIAAMAVHQATNVLLRSSLFASLRDKFETGEQIRFVPAPVYNFIQRLFGCAWCMSIQLSWILLLPFALEPIGNWSFVLWFPLATGRLFVVSLAVSFAANLLHQTFEMEGPSS
jgi:hypothetical protein